MSATTLTHKQIALPAISARRIALPTEHGGWGFLLEPIVAGLAIAFSVGGLWIALMVIGAFITRQPLKMFLIDRTGMRNRQRSIVALKFVLMYSAIFGIGLAGSLLTANFTSLVPFLFVLPLVFLQNYYDIFRRCRQLVPELSGAIAISSSAAAVALAGGLSISFAIALWMIFVLRLVSSIVYVRERLLLEKGKPFSMFLPTSIHIFAIAIIAGLFFSGLASLLTLLVSILLLCRAVSGLSQRRRRLKAVQIGIYEVIYGSFVVGSVIVGHFVRF